MLRAINLPSSFHCYLLLLKPDIAQTRLLYLTTLPVGRLLGGSGGRGPPCENSCSLYHRRNYYVFVLENIGLTMDRPQPSMTLHLELPLLINCF